MNLTIAKDIRTEQVISKSRFICSLKKVKTEEEAQDFIKAVKKEFWDATHNCSAYIIDEQHQRSSDDGEPSGTAGIPMLGVLRKQELQQVAAVVTRYFGGIKLGAGGLVRAYAGSVSQALEEAGLAQKVRMGLYSFACEPGEAGKMLNLLYQQQIFSIADTLYGTQAIFILRMPEERKAQAEQWLTDRLQQQTELTQTGFEYEEVPFMEP
ncbi:MAG: YigZ family protein [Acidaminococcaceae bacterium]|nr:YigZ family protein [Acidaminococcaceae bacterium]